MVQKGPEESHHGRIGQHSFARACRDVEQPCFVGMGLAPQALSSTRYDGEQGFDHAEESKQNHRSDEHRFGIEEDRSEIHCKHLQWSCREAGATPSMSATTLVPHFETSATTSHEGRPLGGTVSHIQERLRPEQSGLLITARKPDDSQQPGPGLRCRTSPRRSSPHSTASPGGGRSTGPCGYGFL